LGLTPPRIFVLFGGESKKVGGRNLFFSRPPTFQNLVKALIPRHSEAWKEGHFWHG